MKLRAALFYGLFVSIFLAWVPVSRGQGVAELTSKLKNTSIESVQLEQATFESALAFLGNRLGGVSFVLLDDAERSRLGNKEVTLSLRGVPAEAVLKYLCSLAGAMYVVESQAVVVGSIADVQGLKALRSAVPKPVAGGRAMTALRLTKMGRVQLTGATVESVAGLLRQAVLEQHKGLSLNVLLVDDFSDGKVSPVAGRTFSLQLNDASAVTVLRYMCELCGLAYRVEERAVLIGSPQSVAAVPSNRLSNKSALYQFLRSREIDKAALVDVDMDYAIEAVRQYTRPEGAPSGGLNVINSVKREPGDREVLLDLALEKVNLLEVIRYVTWLSGTRVRADGMTLIFETDPAIKQRARKKAENETKKIEAAKLEQEKG